VKHLDRPIGGELVEARAEPLFPDGASIPRRGALLLLGEGDRDSAEPSPLRTQPLLVTSPTASVKGTDRLGKKLRATANGWSVPHVTTSYQWLRNGKAIKGAYRIKVTYTPSAKSKKHVTKASSKRVTLRVR